MYLAASILLHEIDENMPTLFMDELIMTLFSEQSNCINYTAFSIINKLHNK